MKALKKECWCPVCGQKTRSGKVRWLWFWVFLFFITPAFPFYLLYCLFTRKRVCERCRNRVKYYSEKEDMEADRLGKI